MLVVVEYISEIKIGNKEIPVYVTDDSRIYVGMEIMSYLKTPQRVKQTIITDKDAIQYTVYPILEVFKYIKNNNLLTIATSSIYKKEHAIIDIEPETLTKQKNGGTNSNPITPEDEFAITLRRMLTPKKKK